MTRSHGDIFATERDRENRPRAALRRALIAAAVLSALASSPPAPGRQIPSTAPSTEVVRATLDNGLRVVVVRDTLAPVVTTVVNYLAGSDEAPPGFPGMAHAQEHMMFRGSPGLDADQLAVVSDSMGGRFDADTQQSVTQYFFTVPAEDLEVALRIEAVRMNGVLDDDALWQKERGAIEQEVAQDLSNPEYVMMTRLLEAMFKGTVYAQDALGTKPSFDKTTGAMLKSFHQSWYGPNNAILVVAGDVTPAAVVDRVRALFGGIRARPTPARPAIRLQPVASQTMNLTTDLPYGLAVVCFRLPGYRDPDFPAVRILSDALGSERGALYGLVPQGLALDAGFAMNPLPRAGLGFAYAAYPAGGDGAGLVQRIRAIVTETASRGIDPDLVAAAQRKAEAADQFRKNSISGLAMEWSQALAVEGRSSPEDATAALKKVTPAAVNAAARHFLRTDRAVSAVLTPAPSGKPTSPKGFGGLESFAPSEVRPVALPAWAEQALGTLRVPPFPLDPVVSTLPNGLTLIVQRETISDSVSLYGRIRNNPDLQTPPGKEGVDRVLDGLFDYGTETLDRLAFQKALDDIGAEESAGTEFSVNVLSRFLDRGVELLAANELRPALPPAAFATTRAQTAAAVAGELKSPDHLAGRALDEALLPPGDPGLREATPATVSSLTLADVRDYHRRVFRPDLTAIVVVGNVDPADARRVVEKYFGAWTAQGPKPATDEPALPPNKAGATDVPDPSRVQDQVVLAQTLGLNRFDPDYYALQLGNHVLGGGFYATRLYRDLREQSGLVYFVSSDLEIGRTRSFYRATYGCDPSNAARARAIIVRDLKDMQSAPASPDELTRAKAVLLREVPLGESSVGEIAAGLAGRSLLGLPLDEPVRAAERYLQLDAGRVREAFARWLRPDGLVQVTQGPAPGPAAKVPAGTS